MSNYDFCGYVTKYNILCSDGRTIMPEAFKNCDGKVVPLTNSRDFLTLDNVLGRVLLENRDDGVYGYGVFNDSQRAKMYQRMVEDRSIEGLGIYANQLKENDKCVTYAVIQSIMLCMYPANPQAKIDIVNKQERKPKGTWIKGPEISRTMIGDKVKCIEYKDYTCSNCGLVLDYLLYHWDGSPFYKFCPECGAEMKEEVKND